MNMPRPRFNWDVSFGHIASIVVVIATAAALWTDLKRDVAEHDRRIATVETVHGTQAERLRETSSAVTLQGRQISQLEATAVSNVGRLNAMDVIRADWDAKFRRIDELMQEVRNELRVLNRRDAAQ